MCSSTMCNAAAIKLKASLIDQLVANQMEVVVGRHEDDSEDLK